jgi:hypothetical protein
MEQPDGNTLIADYYGIAPKIVRAIDKEANQVHIYSILYNCYSTPCIKYIENKEFDKCKVKYIEMVYSLKKIYIIIY